MYIISKIYIKCDNTFPNFDPPPPTINQKVPIRSNFLQKPLLNFEDLFKFSAPKHHVRVLNTKNK